LRSQLKFFLTSAFAWGTLLGLNKRKNKTSAIRESREGCGTHAFTTEIVGGMQKGPDR